jgi:hypothetical protein
MTDLADLRNGLTSFLVWNQGDLDIVAFLERNFPWGLWGKKANMVSSAIAQAAAAVFGAVEEDGKMLFPADKAREVVAFIQKAHEVYERNHINVAQGIYPNLFLDQHINHVVPFPVGQTPEQQERCNEIADNKGEAGDNHWTSLHRVRLALEHALNPLDVALWKQVDAWINEKMAEVNLIIDAHAHTLAEAALKRLVVDTKL